MKQTNAPNRLRYWRQMRGLSLQQLADGTGTSKSQIDKLERGERRLTVDWMVRLAKPLACDPRDLLPIEISNTPSKKEYGNRRKDKKVPLPLREGLGEGYFKSSALFLHTLPVLSAARGGKDQEMFLADGPIDQVPRPHYLAQTKDAYAIYVIGNSMIPMYRPRQLLFVNPYKPPSPGSGVVITKTNGAVLIKEFVKQKATGLVVREYAPNLRDFTIPMADIATIHAVVGAQEPT